MTASDARRPQDSKSASKPQAAQQGDGYYGHEPTARMAAAFITSLFACPEFPPPSNNLTSSGQPVPSPKLAHFVAYALHRTRLTSCVTFAALFLLQRLKQRFPAARGSSGHRLFISAFMIASKVVCDDTYSNKSWAVVGQGMFQLKEINQMEREMCGYLEWHLNVDYLELEQFTDKTMLEYGSGVVNPSLPVTSSIAPAQPKLTAPNSNPAASRLTPSYEDGAAAGTPATLLTSAGDEDEELESPSHSLTSSPASSALQTPPSNADIDGSDGVNVVVPGMQHGSGIIGAAGVNVPAAMASKVMPTSGAAPIDPAKLKTHADRSRRAFASAARW